MRDEMPIVLIVVIVFVAISMVIGGGITRTWWEKEAINSGAAEWQADPKTGDLILVWRVNE